MIEAQPESAEVVRRREAMENASAIVGFAGGVVSPEAKALSERCIRGELTSDQVIEELVRNAKRSEPRGDSRRR